MPLRARDIADVCDELAIERASVSVKEGWDHNPVYYLTFGPRSHPRIEPIDPKWEIKDLKAALVAWAVPKLAEKPLLVAHAPKPIGIVGEPGPKPYVETPKPAPKGKKGKSR